MAKRILTQTSKGTLEQRFAALGYDFEREAARIKRHRWRAKSMGALVDFELIDWLNLLERANHHCEYCGKDTRKLTLDHAIPVARDGKLSKSNIRAVCRRCNSRKGSRLLPHLFQSTAAELLKDFRNYILCDMWDKPLDFGPSPRKPSGSRPSSSRSRDRE